MEETAAATAAPEKRDRLTFTKDNFQNMMLRAGLSPRDLERCMSCHHVTLYTFLRKGIAKPLNEMQYNRLHQFLEDAIAAGLLPFSGSRRAAVKKDLVYRAHLYWNLHNKSLEGYSHN